MNYDLIFKEISSRLAKAPKRGKIATYIPELGTVDPENFGVNLTTVDMQNYDYGDSNERFSIQSISKVLSLVFAYNLENEKLWKRVGVEPAGTPFNSLVQLEADLGIPRNPFINAGALVVCDILVSHLKNPKKELLNFVRDLAQSRSIQYAPKTVASEKSMGFKNAALINLMKSYGNIHNDIDVVLDFYFSLCSIEMSCRELSRAFLFLATDGTDPVSKNEITSAGKSKRINSIMQLCGFYDEAGEFSFKVGLPGKSGVGGGIVAVLPDHLCITVWSPRLNSKGNSYLGMKFLEQFTTRTKVSVF